MNFYTNVPKIYLIASIKKNVCWAITIVKIKCIINSFQIYRLFFVININFVCKSNFVILVKLYLIHCTLSGNYTITRWQSFILFDAMYFVERQIWKFLKFFGDCSQLKKYYWTKINCVGAELGSYDQLMSFNSWFNTSGFKVFSFKNQTFSRFFRSFLSLQFSFVS